MLVLGEENLPRHLPGFRRDIDDKRAQGPPFRFQTSSCRVPYMNKPCRWRPLAKPTTRHAVARDTSQRSSTYYVRGGGGRAGKRGVGYCVCMRIVHWWIFKSVIGRPTLAGQLCSTGEYDQDETEVSERLLLQESCEAVRDCFLRSAHHAFEVLGERQLPVKPETNHLP